MPAQKTDPPKNDEGPLAGGPTPDRPTHSLRISTSPAPALERQPTTSPPSRLLTEPEAAELLRLTPKSLYNLRRAGRLGYLQLGSAIRYRPEHLAAYLDAQEGGAA
jgi:hypothetical protein